MSKYLPLYQKYFNFLLYCFLASLYLTLIFSNIIIIIMVILAIPAIFQNGINLPRFKLYLFSCFILFFGFYVFSLLYTSNIQEGLYIIEKRLSFIAIPIAFSPFKIKQSTLQKLGHFFIHLSFLVCIFLSVKTFISLFYESNFNFKLISNHNLSNSLNFHATYLAMYIGFALLATILSITINTYSTKKNILYLVYLIVFSIIEIFLFARIVLLALAIICTIYIIWHVTKTKQYWLFRYFTAFVILTILLTWQVPPLKERFKEAINYKNQYSVDKQWGGRSLRPLKWNCSYEIIKSNFLFGVGPGDAQNALDQCYKEKKYGSLLYFPNVRYNTHNQYLQEIVNIGLIGAIPFFLIIGIQFFYAIKFKKCVHLLFISLIFIVFFTESVLGLNKGIVFFTLFSCLFSNYYNGNNSA